MVFDGIVAQCLISADNIGCEHLLSGTTVNGIGGGHLDAFDRFQSSFDLFQFYTEATDFHLLVYTAKELDVSSWCATHQVSGFVKTGLRDGVARADLDEALLGALFVIEVTAGQLVPCEVKLAFAAIGDGVHVCIEDVGSRVFYRLTDGDGIGAFKYLCGGREDGIFCGAVGVVHT